MAASDARPVPRKNVAWRYYFDIRKNDGTLITTWAGQDTEVSIDGGNFADATAEATEIQTSGCGYIDLSSDEMNGDCIVIKTTVTNTGAIPVVTTVFPEEVGDYRLATTQKVDVETIKTQAVTCAASVTIRADVGAAAAPGAADGMFIAGTNAPVTISGSGDALTLISTGANGKGLSATGNGSGAGIYGIGGATNGSAGIYGTSGATNGNGIVCIGVGTGHGINTLSVGSGNGITSTGSDLGATVMGTLTQTGAVSWGATTFASVVISGTTTLTGQVTLLSNFGVDGETTLTGKVTVSSDVMIDGTLTYEEAVIFYGPVTYSTTETHTGAVTYNGFVSYAAGITGATFGTVSDAGAAAGDFDTSLSETHNDHYKDAFIVFTSGVLSGQSRLISAYTGSSKNVAVATAFTEAPGNGDAFLILGRSE